MQPELLNIGQEVYQKDEDIVDDDKGRKKNDEWFRNEKLVVASSRRTLIDPAGPLLSHCSDHRHHEGDDEGHDEGDGEGDGEGNEDVQDEW